MEKRISNDLSVSTFFGPKCQRNLPLVEAMIDKDDHNRYLKTDVTDGYHLTTFSSIKAIFSIFFKEKRIDDDVGNR